MRYQNLSLTGTLILSLSLFAGGQAQMNEQNLRALTTMQSVTVIGGFVRDWCVARAPQTKNAVNTGFNGWRQDNKLDVFEKTLTGMSPEAIKSLQTSLEPGRAKMYVELDKAATNPAQECLGIRAYLNGQLNPQKMYPEAYTTALNVKATPTQVSTPKPASPATNAPASAGQPGKLGGPLTIGTYNCRRIRTSGGLPPREYSLNIYSNGQWRQVLDGKEVNTSVYKYDSKTGKIDISYDLNIRNAIFESDADEEFAYFMADKSGAAVIYAEDDYGLGITKTTCVYAGPNKLPSPAQVDATKAKAEAAKAAEREKERNRYRTAPNAGLKLSQIATIIHDFSSKYDGLNTNVEETDTLLLNDGTAYLNLRWTPHDLDVKASRAGEPKQWTRWRKQGGEYQILSSGKWVKLKGLATAPFSKNQRLTGGYSYKSYYQVGWFDNASVSYSESNYYFAQNGTFDRGGLSRTTGGTDMGGIKTSGVAQSNNAGSSGTYSAEGYTLQFKYGNGVVSRAYGFFWSGNTKKLVINGTTYSR